MRTSVWYILFVFILLAIGISSAFYFATQSDTSRARTVNKVTGNNTTTPTIKTDPTLEWKTYTNELMSISLKYPSEKLIACSNTTSSESLILWKAPFSCPEAHDQIYAMSVRQYTNAPYLEFKNEFVQEDVVVNGIVAKKYTYALDANDGPLQSFNQKTDVVFESNDKIIVVEFVGNDNEFKFIFDQVVSTIQFTNVKADSTPSPITITKSYHPSDPLDLTQASISGDVLSIEVGYSGGCEEHEFTLTWDETYTKEVNPPIVWLRLVHNSNNDTCEAYITKTLQFDISEIKDSQENLLNLHIGYQGDKHSKVIVYEY